MIFPVPRISEFESILVEIRDKILPIYNDPHLKVKTKSDKSPVTKADLLSERILLTFLQTTGIPIISEESVNKDSYKTAWVIDPLDGTMDFIEHTDEFSVMIGLLEKGEPVFGIVYQPTTDSLYFAEKGKGAFFKKGSKSIKQLKIKNIFRKKLILVASRNHFSENDKKLAQELSVKDIIHYGSVGLKIGLLCRNKADIYITTTNKMHIWDICAPQIILEESGGKMTDLRGNNLDYSSSTAQTTYGILATNQVIYKPILEKISTNE